MSVMLDNTDTTKSDEPSHIDPRLINLLTRGWDPTPAELEDLVDHLEECISCQIALGAFLIAEKDNTVEDFCKEEVDAILSQLAETICQTDIHDDISAYVESLEIWGEKEAQKQFPLITLHLSRCKACQTAVGEIGDLLRKAEKNRLIAPLSANARC